jgi:hypothetical protein
MATQPEIWFRRARFGGWRPTHWKGFLTMGGGMICAGALAAGGALARQDGHKAVSLLAWGGAACAWAATMVVSWRHSAPGA